MSNENKNIPVTEDDGFTSTKGSGESWNPKAKDKVPYARENFAYDAVAQPDHKEKDILIGYLVDIRYGIGEHKSTVYTFVPKNDLTKKIDVWGDTVLNKEIEKVTGMNILLKLEWLGQGLKKDKKEGQKGASFNKWEVKFKADDVLPGKSAVKLTTTESAITEEKETPVNIFFAKNQASESKVAIPISDDDGLPF